MEAHTFAITNLHNVMRRADADIKVQNMDASGIVTNSARNDKAMVSLACVHLRASDDSLEQSEVKVSDESEEPSRLRL